ncbi:type II toxin-antitoxin system death-on-curing family toxin [Mesorhizobium sp. ESP6-5]|uniref:Death-on-curing family protein n=1 Tax=Mesorhizobium australicum (strain HAMBI 3006 / LMG 24608 / WSM2073) TaxID=754035 RepID=L0KT98_MESAW|nr:MULTISPECIES: type II toxin-antitoxin system death-on-curing family toxin [Mesorhizobium]MBZ9929638.1 type II toxin-antitoxin system death-on-curing family toxin [Mesorhizobium sp. BR1-1-5]AGB47288.1 death-on-curing family protein [Mesorhizobium australicum WSM2073]MBZ9694791.1 type II toxin-antitoxin system death-on-curing family toxin [Mesorhizobium sp. CO1-1-9]MBZ9755739.1 type II toxin-antitoxin system death-on-curing family toxin [Mesorhizobium sp. ESP6-5]MBZ9909289.1 type II toxin-ant
MTAHHSREFVEAMHAEQLRLHGGASGIRDEGLLESALARPQQKEAYGEPDLSELAAAYLFGIAKNHPFVDGNKRTAFAAADLFLYFNGLSIEAEQEEVIQLVMMVAASEIDEAGAAAFFRDHVVKLED